MIPERVPGELRESFDGPGEDRRGKWEKMRSGETTALISSKDVLISAARDGKKPFRKRVERHARAGRLRAGTGVLRFALPGPAGPSAERTTQWQVTFEYVLEQTEKRPPQPISMSSLWAPEARIRKAARRLLANWNGIMSSVGSCSGRLADLPGRVAPETGPREAACP